jgi:diaminopimelate decarboxylase
MHEYGCKAEVVSHDEWHLAMLCGIDGHDVIYNGPMKSHNTFMEAVASGAIVNIETKRELHWLTELPKSENYKVGIRLNINLSNISAKDAVRENDNSRFGFSDDSDDLADAIAFIRALPNVRISGLHLHRTTQARRVNFYRHIVRYAARIIKKYGLSLDYLDIGGGFYGTLPGKPSYSDYILAIRETLEEQEISDLELIVEPGTALIDNAVQFITEVIDLKAVENGMKIITTNGSRMDIDPFFRKKSYICRRIGESQEPRTTIAQQLVCGCTCIEEDRLTKLTNFEEIKIGDRLEFSNVGAYTMTLTPLFIRYLPNVYLIADGNTKLIRQAWTANDIYSINTQQCTE